MRSSCPQNNKARRLHTYATARTGAQPVQPEYPHIPHLTHWRETHTPERWRPGSPPVSAHPRRHIEARPEKHALPHLQQPPNPWIECMASSTCLFAFDMLPHKVRNCEQLKLARNCFTVYICGLCSAVLLGRAEQSRARYV